MSGVLFGALPPGPAPVPGRWAGQPSQAAGRYGWPTPTRPTRVTPGRTGAPRLRRGGGPRRADPSLAPTTPALSTWPPAARGGWRMCPPGVRVAAWHRGERPYRELAAPERVGTGHLLRGPPGGPRQPAETGAAQPIPSCTGLPADHAARPRDRTKPAAASGAVQPARLPPSEAPSMTCSPAQVQSPARGPRSLPPPIRRIWPGPTRRVCRRTRRVARIQATRPPRSCTTRRARRHTRRLMTGGGQHDPATCAPSTGTR